MAEPVLLSGGPLNGRTLPCDATAPGLRLTVLVFPDLVAVEDEPHALVLYGDGKSAKAYHRHRDGVFRTIGQGQAVYVVGGDGRGMFEGVERAGGEVWPVGDGRWHGESHGAVELWK